MATSWSTWGRDEKQSFCSPDGVLSDSLTTLWRYTPASVTPSSDKTYISADSGGVYSVFVRSASYPGTAEKVSHAGGRLWLNTTWSQGGPEPGTVHPCLTSDGGVLILSDGIRKLSASSGSLVQSVTYDIWGYAINDPAGSKIYLNNTYTNGDTPSSWGLFVGSYPIPLVTNLTWRSLYYYTGRSSTYPLGFNTFSALSMAYNGGNLYVGIDFKQTGTTYIDGQGYLTVDTNFQPHDTGIYVLDAVTGEQRNYIATQGFGPKIAVGSYLFSAEVNIDNTDVLVKAYDLDTLGVAWSASIGEGVVADLFTINNHIQYSPYPVVVGNLVLIPSATKITAYNQSTGAVVWTYTQPVPFTSDYNMTLTGYIMAAAAATNTLVVCQNDSNVRLLDLTDGSTIWTGIPTGVTGKPINPIIYEDRVYLTEYGAAGTIIAMQSGTSVPPPADTTAPTVAIASPANGATISGVSSVTITSSDDVAVARLEFYANDILKSTISYPASTSFISFNTADFINGSYPLYCRAIDAAGNIGTSSTIDVTIDNAPPVIDTTPPELTMTSPTSSTAPTKGNLTITGVATDDSGISLINIKVNGVVIGQCTGASRCSKNYPVKKLLTGANTIAITAKDTFGNSTTVTKTVNKV